MENKKEKWEEYWNDFLDAYKIQMGDNAKKRIEGFISELLQTIRQEAIGSVLLEEGIKWQQEGNNKDRKGYTEGFNACRQQIIANAKKKFNIDL